MLPHLKLIAVSIVILIVPPVESWLRQDVQMLYDQLFKDYNKDLGPKNNQSESIDIHIVFELYSINEFDDKTGKFSVLLSFNLTWTDDRIAWDPSQHGNVTSVHLHAPKVWTPTLYIGKPYTDVKPITNDLVKISYNSKGKASWIVSDLYHVSCTADVANYPFDKQLCNIYILAASFLADNYDFILPYNSVTTSNYFFENGIWSVLSTEVRLVGYPPYANYVEMDIKFQRRPLFVIVVLLLPIGIIGLLNTFVFLLPPDPGERSSYSVTLMLAMAVFLSTVSDKLPNTSEPHVARVCLYLLVDLILSGIIMVFTVGGLLLHNRKDAPIPEWTKRLVLTCTKRQSGVNQRSLANDNRIQPKTPKWRHIKVESINEQLADDKDGFDDKTERHTTDHQTFRDEIHFNDKTEDTSIDDISKSCSWSDVGKLFDRFCLILFLSLQVCRLATAAIDTGIYLSSDA